MRRAAAPGPMSFLRGIFGRRSRPPLQPESAWAGSGAGPDQPRPRLADRALEAQLEEQGYAVAPGFLDPTGIEELAGLSAVHDAAVHHRPFGASLHSEDVPYRQAVDAGIRALLGRRIEEIAPGYRLCFGNFLAKAPVGPSGEAGEVKLHQDVAFVNEAKFQTMSFWIPLTDTDEENGCLRLVPGSHLYSQSLRWAGAPFAFAGDERSLLERAKAVPVRAGDAVIFSAKLVHWSAPNRGSGRRLVAGGLAAPKAAPLIYLHQDPDAPDILEVYRVRDDFYATHTYRTRPRDADLVARIPARQARLAPDFRG